MLLLECVIISLFKLCPPPGSTLFPYTTLFRSRRPSRRAPSRCRIARGSGPAARERYRSEEHTSELQSLRQLVCRLLLEKKKTKRPSRAMTLTASVPDEDCRRQG